jgi:hypothetical protein
MTSIRRRTVRGAAAGMGALAIIAGTAACGMLGGDDAEGEGTGSGVEEPAEQDPGEVDARSADSEESEDGAETDEDAAESGTDSAEEGDDAGAEADPEAGEGEDAAAGEPLSEQDLTAAGDRFHAFFRAIGDEDPEAACGLVIDHETGEPTTGDGLETCLASFDDASGEGFNPSMVDMLQREMIEAEDHGDGRASISVMGEATDMLMQKADDGQWYILADSPF